MYEDEMFNEMLDAEHGDGKDSYAPGNFGSNPKVSPDQKLTRKVESLLHSINYREKEVRKLEEAIRGCNPRGGGVTIKVVRLHKEIKIVLNFEHIKFLRTALENQLAEYKGYLEEDKKILEKLNDVFK